MKNLPTQFVSLLIISLCLLACDNDDDNPKPDPDPPSEVARVDTFTFSGNGEDTKGIIYIPAGYHSESDWPSIYLLDYKDTHFADVTDEFEQLVSTMLAIEGLKALVVTLEEHRNLDVGPDEFEEHRDLFISMTEYVDNNYSVNTSRTFVGRGSEGGVVLLTMLTEDPQSRVFEKYVATDSPNSFNTNIIGRIQNEQVPDHMTDIKLHFSYSSSNVEAVCIALINNIEDANYPWLSFASAAYPTMTYPQAYTTAFTDGLEFVFKD